MKKIAAYLLIAILGIAFQNVYAKRPGAGVRIDYFDKTGKWVDSYVVDDYPGSPLVFGVNQSDNLLNIHTVHGVDSIFSIKFVPWGTESYPLTVDVKDGSNMKIEREIIGGEGTRSLEDVLCGTRIRFRIEVAEGEYPAVSILDEYSMMSFEDKNDRMQKYSSLGLLHLLDRKNSYAEKLLNMDFRKSISESIDDNGIFTRDENIPNVWYFELTMSNEPMTLKFETERADRSLLRSSCLKTLTGLYSQISYGLNGFNSGESAIMSFFGDYISDDMIGAYLAHNNTSSAFDLSFLNEPNYIYTNVPWVNNFFLISKANLLLDNLNKFDVSEKDREIVSAQMLTLRSHAYWRILQCYGKRWHESDNGAILCAPLETSFNTENLPLSSMKEIADQCYADLDEAISIFSKYNYERDNIIEPDLTVARGVKMRLALLREDWKTTASLAEQILNSVPLTTNEQLTSGFFNPEDSWIWGSWNYSEYQGEKNNNVYYWSKLSFDSCNGHYCSSWGMGTNAISKDLYDSMNPSDIRRTMFLMPERFSDEAQSMLDWWYNVNNISSMSELLYRNSSAVYNLYDGIMPDGVMTPAFRQIRSNRSISIRLGAQTKFYQPGKDQFSDAAVVFMRTDEALLTLAEACYRMGNEDKARELLVKLNGMRIPGYFIDKKNDELLKEIQLTRKIELWGEGHSWFDTKRWNLPLQRRAWVAGDVKSGNWPSKYAESVQPELFDGWRFVIPSRAILNNPLIDVAAAGYKESAVKNMISSKEDMVNTGNDKDIIDVQLIEEPVEF